MIRVLLQQPQNVANWGRLSSRGVYYLYVSETNDNENTSTQSIH